MRNRLLPVLLIAAACGTTDRPAPAAQTALVEIPSPAADGAGEPNLATGPDGRAYLSWIEPGADSTHVLRFAVLEGERWSAARTISQGRRWFVNWADFPMLQVMPNGRMAAHWLERSADGTYTYDVRVVRSSDGGATWGPATIPHRDGVPAEHGFVAMWPAAGDSVGMVWLDGREYAGKEEGAPGAQTQLRSALVGPEGGSGTETLLDARTCDCCQNAAALTADGPLVVYRDRTEDEIRDIYSVRFVDGRWTEPAVVHADRWKVPFCPVNGPSVAANGRRAVVAWFSAADSVPKVQVAFSDDAGATWAAPVRLDGGTPAGRVDVELLDDGALVSWLEQAGGGAEVRVRRVARDGTLGEPRTIASSSAARSSGFPRMTRSGDQLVFAWTLPGTPARIHTARLPLEGL